MGGGGTRGLAHIGVLRVLDEFGLTPDEYCGTSIGSLFAGLAASGLTPDEMEAITYGVKKNDLMAFNYWELLTKGWKAPSIFKTGKLIKFFRSVLKSDFFEELDKPLFVNTVDIDSGANIVWGLPGLRNVAVSKAIAASCALPPVYSPVKLAGRWYVEGSIVNNLLLRVARFRGAERVIAVNLKTRGNYERRGVAHGQGFMAILDRCDNISSQVIFDQNLAKAHDKAHDMELVLINPNVTDRAIFDYKNLGEVIKAGELAAREALENHHWMRGLDLFDKSKFRPLYEVDTERCLGCGLCVMNCDSDLYKIKNGVSWFDAERREECVTSYSCIKTCPSRAITMLEGSTPP